MRNKTNEEIINNLNNSEIISMNIDPIKFTIEIEFFDPIIKNNIKLKLIKIALLKLSKNIKDEDGNYFVVHIDFRALYDGGLSVFPKLGYSYFDMEGNTLIYPNTTLYYLSIEGDLCLDIVCTDFKIN